MVSINTNLSSLIVQNNLTKSTNALNTAIERMTTGFKINHAADNAANYSISNNYSSKLSSYSVAQDNISAGLDLLATAQDTISLMQSHGERLMNLWTQAQNGTYGSSSLNAIQQEVNAITSEINRLYQNAEYNGISLFDYDLPDWAKTVKENAGKDAGTVGNTTSITASHNGFIEEAHHIDDAEVNSMEHVAGLDSFVLGKTYAITTKADLQNLANLVNDGEDTTGVTFVMGADIDLGAVAENVSNWTAIGEEGIEFKGIFDGNGHKIKNLSINNAEEDNQGLFGVTSGDSIIKNVGVEGRVKGGYNVGLLVGYALGDLTNNYATGSVSGNTCVGGLVGYTESNVSNSYATGSVTGQFNIGGLVGSVSDGGTITNSYSTGSVNGGSCAGGLAGFTGGHISNSYATGSVTGQEYVGGLVGESDGSIESSYSKGSVSGKDMVGGLVGYSEGSIESSYSTGSVLGENSVGGLVGHSEEGSIESSYSTGSVSGKCSVGGLVGLSTGSIESSYSTGSVSGEGSVGGLVGDSGGSIASSYSTGSVSGKDSVGGLVGWSEEGSISSSYSTGSVSGESSVGGLVGEAYGSIEASYSTGSVSGDRFVGGLVGYSYGSIESSYSAGSVSGDRFVGGLVGGTDFVVNDVELINTASYGAVSGTYCVGTLIGAGYYEDYGTQDGSLTITNATASIQDGVGFIGGFTHFNYDTGGETVINPDYDMTPYLQNIQGVQTQTALQVGINGDESSRISFNTKINAGINISDISSKSAYDTITSFLNTLSSKATELGTISNRLESALESTSVSMENLTSSLSTIRDADIAKESSQYIKAQILQQASATLLATANQSPAIALQLI